MSKRFDNVQRLFLIIADLKTDCEDQYYTLKEHDDVSWDCFNKDHWENMINNIKELETLIIGEMHEASKTQTKTTREYGKEL